MNFIKKYQPDMKHQTPIRVDVMAIVCKTLTIEKIELDQDLIDSGLLDSLSLVQLMVALEEEFNIKFEPEDLNFDDYRSVRSMTEMITRLLLMNLLPIRVSR